MHHVLNNFNLIPAKHSIIQSAKQLLHCFNTKRTIQNILKNKLLMPQFCCILKNLWYRVSYNTTKLRVNDLLHFYKQLKKNWFFSDYTIQMLKKNLTTRKHIFVYDLN